MAKKDLINFQNKIEQLNKLIELIENNPAKKKELSDCKNHEEVIRLTSKWGFEISKRWGRILNSNFIVRIIKLSNDFEIKFLEFIYMSF